MALQGSNHKHPYIVQLLETQFKLNTLGKQVIFAWIPSHTGIQGNEKADKLAKEALDLDVSERNIPYTDLKTKINTYIKDKWQTSWNLNPQNKLYQHKPIIEPLNSLPLAKRREDIVLTRARIGHTHLTHAYLFAAEDPPHCISCNSLLTVKHILIDCVEFAHIRTNYYNNIPDLKSLFRDVSRSCVINFLKEINFFIKF